MKSHAVLASLFMLALPLATHAQENINPHEAPPQNTTHHKGWFIGGGYGMIDVATQRTNLPKQDRNAQAVSVYGGYQFNHWFALEGHLFGSNNLHFSYTDVVESYASGLFIAPKFIYALSPQLSAYGKVGAGVLLYDETYDNRHSWQGGREESWGSGEAAVGLGLEYRYHSPVVLRLSYDYSEGTLEDTEDRWYFRNDADVKLEVSQLALGFYYQF